MIRSAAAILFVSLVVGCSSVPVDIEQAPRARAASVIDPSVLAAAPDRGLVRIVRDGGPTTQLWPCSSTLTVGTLPILSPIAFLN